MTIIRDKDLIFLVFAGRYNDPDSWQLPVKIVEDFVVPAFFPAD